jgi:hypothetical protein
MAYLAHHDTHSDPQHGSGLQAVVSSSSTAATCVVFEIAYGQSLHCAIASYGSLLLQAVDVCFVAHLYSEMVASSGRPVMISTLNLFSWNIDSASSLLTTTLWKFCFSLTICKTAHSEVKRAQELFHVTAGTSCATQHALGGEETC